MISNGSFEIGNTGFHTDYVYTTDLTASGTVVVGRDPREHHPLAASYGDHTSGSGRMLIANGSVDGNASVWEQTVPVETDTEYAFFYWLSAWTDAEIKQAQIRCLINEIRVGAAGFPPAIAGEWGFVLIRWNSGPVSEAKIRLVDRTGTIEKNDFALDDIGMMAVGDDYLLVTSSTNGGWVESPGEGPWLYPPGELVYLEAKCEPGYEFDGWAGNFSGTGPGMFIEVNADFVATATFRKLDHDVTIKASPSAPNGFSTCDETADRLATLQDALTSHHRHGLTLGRHRGVCDATYLFPILKPQAGISALTRIAVHVYGSTISVGPVVRIADAAPCRPTRGEVHEVFTGAALEEILSASEGPVCWLAVEIDAAMGAWDLAGVYLSYDCPTIPRSLLRRFHDHFSIYQALATYARDPGLRDLFDLRANEECLWETLVRTTAFAEDLAGYDHALPEVVETCIDTVDDLPGLWQSLADSPDPTVLAGSGSEAIVPCLDAAVSSGQSYILACAAAVGDGLVAGEEAIELDEKLAVWRADLEALKIAMSATFERLGEVHRQAKAAGQGQLANTAEKMIRSMGPWHTAEPDDFGFWISSSPTYLEEILRILQDPFAQDVTAP
jgi:hypothetical protein